MTTKKAGIVDLGSGKKQHVDLWRKVKLRRDLIGEYSIDGAAYVPFLGEGDIAAELYLDRRIVGVELEPDVATTAQRRLSVVQADELTRDPDAPADWTPLVIIGDANVWPPAAPPIDYAIADVDAFSNPYHSIEAFWRSTPRRGRVVIFGTDGMRMAMQQSKSRVFGPLPDLKVRQGTMAERREQYNAWWSRWVRPYLEDLFAPWTITHDAKYQRSFMLYWGVVVDPPTAGAETPPPGSAAGVDEEARPPAAELDDQATPDQIRKVEAALLEAASSGNVPAAIFWLEHKGGPTWTKAAKANAAEIQLEQLLGPKRRSGSER